jgi:hypothetical protein
MNIRKVFWGLARIVSVLLGVILLSLFLTICFGITLPFSTKNTEQEIIFYWWKISEHGQQIRIGWLAMCSLAFPIGAYYIAHKKYFKRMSPNRPRGFGFRRTRF